MVFHLLRIWLAKVFGSKFGSSQKTKYKLPLGGFPGIGSGGDYAGRKGRGLASMDRDTIGMTFTESEERMMEDVKMQSLKAYQTPVSSSDTPSTSGDCCPPAGHC